MMTIEKVITEKQILRRRQTILNARTAIVLLTLFLFTACASTPDRKPEKRETPPPKFDRPVAIVSPPAKHTGFIFSKAEKLFAEKRYSEAAEAYLEYLKKTAPDDRLADNAYLKTGLCWFEMGRYRDALYYFEALPKKYPNSDVYSEALLNTAISYFYLNDNEKAEEIFNKALPLLGLPGKRAYVHFFRAGMKSRKGQFEEAVELYVKSETMADNERLVKAARARVEKIFHNFLGEEALKSITFKYSGMWPSKMAFTELFNIYKRSGESSLLDEVKIRYAKQFPSKKKPLGEWLSEGNENYKPESPKIGAVLPLSGSGARAGREILQGIQLAFNSLRDLANEKNIKPIVKDSSSNPKNAEEALIELAKDRDVILTLGPAFSEAFERAAQIADRYRMPVLSPSASAEGLASVSDHLFRNTITNSLEGKKLANLAVNELGLKRFAIIYPNDPYGREIVQFFVHEVELLGGEVLAAEWYDPTQTDFKKQIKNIGGMSDESLRKTILSVARSNPSARPAIINSILAKDIDGALASPKIESYGGFPITGKNFRPGLSINYDAVFLPGSYEKVGLILPELTFYNIKNVVRITDKDANHRKFPSIAEKYAEGVIFMDGFFARESSPHVKTFVRNYQVAFREEPTLLAAQAYDAARMALSAIAHGATSRKEMTAYLKNIRFFEGVSGVTSIMPSGDADKSMISLTVKNGAIVEFDPVEFRRAMGKSAAGSDTSRQASPL